MSSRQAKKRRKKQAARPPFKRLDVPIDALKSIIERGTQDPLNTEDYEQLVWAVDTLALLTQEIEAKGTTIARLRKILFGSTSEKSKKVIGKQQEKSEEAEHSSNLDKECNSVSGSSQDDEAEGKEHKKKKRKGHGRNSAEAYVEAEQVAVSHNSLGHKDCCPCCEKGKVYQQNDPAILVRVRGVSPLSATVYHKERLRCNLCGEVFTADSPAGIGEQKYDETAAAMLGLLKYGCGLPFNRIQKLGDNLGIPLPASTQWDVVEKAAQSLEAVWAELVRQAAQGDVVYIDDTKMKILALNSELQKSLAAGKDTRTGVFTSGIVSNIDGHEIVLFYTGNKHAGENLEAVLKQRECELEPPIQMSDALASNSCGEFETLLASCLVHGRRNFVDVVDSFPDEVSHVLLELGKIYKHDAECKEQELTPEARLEHHQQKSKPIMDELERWFKKQLDEKLVEPNSGLGKAIRYMQNHWEKLTLFLRVVGAPLDNNMVERALKRVILHRKNSLFYKTQNGAFVGDLWMSLIHSAELCGVMPFEYLVQLQRHQNEVEEVPEDWMPWNYQETLAQLGQPP